MTRDIPAWIGTELQPMDKLSVHRQGLRHPAISVFVVAQGRLLIQQRALGKYHTPGFWANTCCTHPDWGEDPLDCAHRRLIEELGLYNMPLVHRGQVEYRADVGGDMIEHEVVDLFLAECSEIPDLSPNPEEVMATRWVTRDELNALLLDDAEQVTPWMRIYLREHADKVLPGF